MLRVRFFLVSAVMTLATINGATAQRALTGSRETNSEIGPVMRAYLGYLRNEQEVVDDRISRREISPEYYRRNSSRIRALRQTAIRLVTQSGNDYVPELEAVTGDELGILFENPPSPKSFRSNQIVRNTFRYLGTVHTGEAFYVFARLDPYEQAALLEANHAGPQSVVNQPEAGGATRPRNARPR